MSNFIYSTLTSDQIYRNYAPVDLKTGNDIPRRLNSVFIKGRISRLAKDQGIETPRGVVTQVTDDELIALKANCVFQLHIRNGFLKIETVKTKISKVIDGMEARDEASLMEVEDFEKLNGAAPKIE